MKTALITGITGQDGFYLSEFLFSKNYDIHGIVRPSQNNNVESNSMIEELVNKFNVTVHYCDMVDSLTLHKIVKNISPDEIYNLAAQSHVGLSFDFPEYTFNINSLGCIRILESIKDCDLIDKTKLYQASTSEMFGNATEFPQTENTPFSCCSPYASSKLAAYWATMNYRDSYDMQIFNGILFNHESPRRGKLFVTRKITDGLAKVKLGIKDCLYLGNIHTKRDWGHAKDYVRAQWMMMQSNNSDNYIIASGEHHSIKEFVEYTCKCLDIELIWKGKDIDEIGIDVKTNKEIIKIDSKLFRYNEVNSLLGDYSKAYEKLGWYPEISFAELVKEMVKSDLDHNK